MKRALVIRHVPHEGMAGYRDPVEAAGYEIDRIDVADPAFSSLDLREPDLLIMMGGPMGVYEQDQYPWIKCQLHRLQQRLGADRPTLGVCFGAQMIAAALGARVYAGPVKEVGFHAVEVNETGRSGPLTHLVDVPVLHWHGDTFTLPEGVELLASSHRYEHQAFRRGPNLLALQFHAEMGEDERFHQWIEEWPEAAIEAGGCNDSLRAAHEVHGPRAVGAGRAMVTEWLAEIDAARGRYVRTPTLN
jgi:GMP synthase (glutamine-hydrolysing)